MAISGSSSWMPYVPQRVKGLDDEEEEEEVMLTAC
jgi:hypothetical protein